MSQNAGICITEVESRFPATETHFGKSSWRNSQPQPGGDSATSRETTFRRRRRGHNHRERKKNPWNFCEELEGYPDSCNSNKLDWLSDDFPPCAPAASQLTDLELRSWAGRWQQGHSAAGYTFAPKKCALHLRTKLTLLSRQETSCGVVWSSRTLFQAPPACHHAVPVQHAVHTGQGTQLQLGDLLFSRPNLKWKLSVNLKGPVCSSQGNILADTEFNNHHCVFICV